MYARTHVLLKNCGEYFSFLLPVHPRAANRVGQGISRGRQSGIGDSKPNNEGASARMITERLELGRREDQEIRGSVDQWMQGVNGLGLMACRYCFFASFVSGRWALHIETLYGVLRTECIHPVVWFLAVGSLFFFDFLPYICLRAWTCGLALHLPIGGVFFDLISRR